MSPVKVPYSPGCGAAFWIQLKSCVCLMWSVAPDCQHVGQGFHSQWWTRCVRPVLTLVHLVPFHEDVGHMTSPQQLLGSGKSLALKAL